MAIVINAGFSLPNYPLPNFTRDQVASISELQDVSQYSLDPGHIVYCAEDKKYYVFNPDQPEDSTLGYFREMTGRVVYDDSDDWQESVMTDSILSNIKINATTGEVTNMYSNTGNPIQIDVTNSKGKYLIINFEGNSESRVYLQQVQNNNGSYSLVTINNTGCNAGTTLIPILNSWPDAVYVAKNNTITNFQYRIVSANSLNQLHYSDTDGAYFYKKNGDKQYLNISTASAPIMKFANYSELVTYVDAHKNEANGLVCSVYNDGNTSNNSAYLILVNNGTATYNSLGSTELQINNLVTNMSRIANALGNLDTSHLQSLDNN